MKKLFRKTKRLEIRPFEIIDFENWKQSHLTMQKPQNQWDAGCKKIKDVTLQKFKKILKDQKQRRAKDYFYDLGVFDSQGALVGGVSLMEVTRGISHTAFLGYRIFNNYWGLGYGKEAVKAMIDIGFKDIKLHRIEAGIEPQNLRSIALAKSLKMRPEGCKKRAVYLDGKWVDLLMFTLTTEDLGLKFDVKKTYVKPRW